MAEEKDVFLEVAAAERKECPESRAGCCSRVVFSWVSPTVSLARKKVLEEEDLPEVSDEDRADKFGAQFKALWDKFDAEAAAGKGTSPTMARVLISMFRGAFFRAFFFKLVHDCFAYATPVLLKEIVSQLEEGGAYNIGDMPAGYVFAICLFCGQIIQTLCLNRYFHIMYGMGMNVRCTVITAVYQKSLRISMAAQHDSSTGQIVNLMSNDAQRMMMFMAYVHNIWSAPFQIVVAFALLVNYIGPVAFVGLAVILLSVPLKGVFLKKIGFYRKVRHLHTCTHTHTRTHAHNTQVVVGITDKRVKLINDVLQVIAP